MADLRKRRACRWCGLRGHRLHACWVKAEGRVRPDEHDRAAAEFVEAISEGGKVSLIELRRHVARMLRRIARRAA